MTTSNHLSKLELEQLEEKMNSVCEKISKKFYCLKSNINNLNKLLETNFNKNFDEQELMEEQMDELIFEYSKIKDLLKKGREIRYYKEVKEKKGKEEKENNNFTFTNDLIIHH